MIAVLSRPVSACDEVVPSGPRSEEVHGLNNAERSEVRTADTGSVELAGRTPGDSTASRFFYCQAVSIISPIVQCKELIPKVGEVFVYTC
jgi:hypothetical protein